MKWRTHLALIAAVSFTTACGGGGAGDAFNTSGENTLGTSQLEPLVGIWQLSSGWSTNATDEALLVVRTPSTAGEAVVVLYDFTDEADTSSQCFREPFGNGTLEDAITGDVFINFSEFTNGIVTSINENTIMIEFEDSNDINGNGNTSDRVTTTLTRVAQTESDISPLCDS